MSITRAMYYRDLSVLFNVIYQCMDKEVAFIPFGEDNKAKMPIRHLMAQYVDMLKRHFDQFDFWNQRMNIYHSLATYTNRPMFSYHYRTKAIEQRIWLTEFKNYITGYDLFIETDNKDIEIAKTDTKKIKTFYDSHPFVYSISFSGSKGFHLLSPYTEFKFLGLKIYSEALQDKQTGLKDLLKTFPMSIETMRRSIDLVTLFKVVAVRMRLLLGCDSLDDSVQDIKRIIKIKMSWDIKSNLIALPLSDSEFDNFQKPYAEPLSVLKRGIYKRGMLWRNTTLPRQTRENNILELLRDLGILDEKQKNIKKLMV